MVFEKDEFVRNYIASLKFIQTSGSDLSSKKIDLKFEELMLHLLEKYPLEILSFQLRNQEEYSDIEVRKAVEENITSNVTLEELAFLCNASVSTFKRRFVKLYHTTPRQYFLERKMEMATSLLLQNENKAAGLDIEQYKILLRRDTHRLKPNGVHTVNGGNWLKRWDEFFARNLNASRHEILEFLDLLRAQFGI